MDRVSKKKDKKKDKKRDRDRDRDRDRRQSREEVDEDESARDDTPKKTELEAFLDRKFKGQQQDLEKLFDTKIELSEKKLKN